MEIECEKCGEICEVEEAKSNVHIAWCHECENYITTDRDIDAEVVADDIDAEMDRRKYEGI